jgi:hypothetical protein
MKFLNMMTRKGGWGEENSQRGRHEHGQGVKGTSTERRSRPVKQRQVIMLIGARLH